MELDVNKKKDSAALVENKNFIEIRLNFPCL